MLLRTRLITTIIGYTFQHNARCVPRTRWGLSHLQGVVLALFSRGVEHEVAGDLAAGTNEAHNVGVKGQLALQVNLLPEQLQGLHVQPCTTKSSWSTNSH